MRGFFYGSANVISIVLLYLLWLRVLLQYFQVEMSNPVRLKINTWTRWLLLPVCWLPARCSSGRIEWPTLFIALLLDFIRLAGIVWGLTGLFIKPTILALVLCGHFCVFPLQWLFYLMVLRVITGWIPACQNTSIRTAILQMTDPFIRYSQDAFPPVAGFDFAPLVWMIVLKGVSFFIYASMPLHL